MLISYDLEDKKIFSPPPPRRMDKEGSLSAFS